MSENNTKKQAEEIKRIYDEFSSKIKQIEKERDGKIMDVIKKIEERQIEDIKNSIS